MSRLSGMSDIQILDEYDRVQAAAKKRRENKFSFLSPEDLRYITLVDTELEKRGLVEVGGDADVSKEAGY